MTMGQRIKEQRDKNGLSQNELAIKLGYKSRSSLNKIEMDLQEMPVDKVKMCSTIFGCSVAYLMGWEEDDPEEMADLLADADLECLELFNKLNDENKCFIKKQMKIMLELQKEDD
jgi:transcriptional regulator with XRE-family HTH domain